MDFIDPTICVEYLGNINKLKNKIHSFKKHKALIEAPCYLGSRIKLIRFDQLQCLFLRSLYYLNQIDTRMIRVSDPYYLI